MKDIYGSVKDTFGSVYDPSGSPISKLTYRSHLTSQTMMEFSSVFTTKRETHLRLPVLAYLAYLSVIDLKWNTLIQFI